VAASKEEKAWYNRSGRSRAGVLPDGVRLTKALPVVTFERLRRLCVENKRGEYFVKESDETVQHVQDERTWMVTSLW